MEHTSFANRWFILAHSQEKDFNTDAPGPVGVIWYYWPWHSVLLPKVAAPKWLTSLFRILSHSCERWLLLCSAALTCWVPILSLSPSQWGHYHLLLSIQTAAYIFISTTQHVFQLPCWPWSAPWCSLADALPGRWLNPQHYNSSRLPSAAWPSNCYSYLG